MIQEEKLWDGIILLHGKIVYLDGFVVNNAVPIGQKVSWIILMVAMASTN